MIRVVIALSTLLLASVVGNLAQWRSSIITAEQHTAAIEIAGVQAVADARGEALTRTSLVYALAVNDNQHLLAALASIVERSRERVTVYRDRVVTAPPLAAICAPGEIRVDAINTLLGHDQ